MKAIALRRVPLVPVLAVLVLGAAGPAGVRAQSFSLGADLVSRYIWRGIDFGEAVSIQPSLSFSSGGFEIGTWASYGITLESGYANEHDLWIGYSVPVGSGSLTLGATDYYFPNAGVDFFSFEDDGAGAHWIEPFVSFSGPASFPISLYAGYFVYNDPDNSLFLEASYPLAVDGVDLAFSIAASGGESALYQTDGFGIIQTSIAASKAIPITDQFSLPVAVKYIVNPYLEKSYLVFGLTF